MAFKKKNLIAAIIYNKDNYFLVTYSRDTNGLKFMNGVVPLSLDSIEISELGEICLNGLKDFKFKVTPPGNINNFMKPLLKQVGCNSWSELVNKFDSISFEGQSNKYVTIQPAVKEGGIRSRYYATNQGNVVKVGWNAEEVGKAILQIITKLGRMDKAHANS